jgi:anti-sigma B factor antagonist
MDNDARGPSRIQVTNGPSQTVVGLYGDVDATLRDEASAAMGKALGSPSPVLFDASSLRFIDSTGIAFVLQLNMAAREAGLGVSIWDPNSVVTSLLEAIGMGGAIPRADSEPVQI